MYINKKGKFSNEDENSSRIDNSSVRYENINSRGNTQIAGRSPTTFNRYGDNRKNMDLDKSTHESGPEIMYIETNTNDRRNQMMMDADGRQSDYRFRGGNINNSNSNMSRSPQNISRNSVLTNVKNEVAGNRDLNAIANSSIPIYLDAERERSPKVINLDDSHYSSNTRTLNQKRANYSGTRSGNQNGNGEGSESTGRRMIQINQGTNSIVKKMSPNRNNDMNIDINDNQRNFENVQKLKKLSIVAENNKTERPSGKPEYSVDTKDHINQRYTSDIEKIIRKNGSTEQFQTYNSLLVNNNPKEGKLYTTNTKIITPVIQKQLEEQKAALKKMNKLSTILIKNRKADSNFGKSTVRSTSGDYQDRTLRKNMNSTGSSSRKFIRVTMALLSSKGPNAEDRIITRQLRADKGDKGGVVDFAQSTKRSPKRVEVKKAIASKTTKPLGNRQNREREVAAKIVQKWWRDILDKYKVFVEKAVTIQKSWRRFFVRKNLYYKLSAYYFYSYLFDKIENIIRRHNLVIGYEAFYNQNAAKYNAIKYLRNVIYIQRAYRYYRNLKLVEKKKQTKLFGTGFQGKGPIQTSKVVKKIPQPKGYESQVNNISKSRNDIPDDHEDTGLVGNRNPKRHVPDEDLEVLKKKYEELKKTNFRSLIRRIIFTFSKKTANFCLNTWRRNIEELINDEIELSRQGKSNEAKQSVKPVKTTNLDDSADLDLFFKMWGKMFKKTVDKIDKRRFLQRFRTWKANVERKRPESYMTFLHDAVGIIEFVYRKKYFSNVLKAFEITKRRKLLKKFVLTKQKTNRNNIQNIFKTWKILKNQKPQIVEKEKQVPVSAPQKPDDSTPKLSAVSKLVPALAGFLRKHVAKNYKVEILSLLMDKNRNAALKNILRFINISQKQKLHSYFNKMKNYVTEVDAKKAKDILLRSVCKRLIQKSSNNNLKRNFNQWWRMLPTAVNASVKDIYPFDRLKQALQKRYCEHPLYLLRNKTYDSNYDWSLKFFVNFRKKHIKRDIRSYINLWRKKIIDLENDDKVNQLAGNLLNKFKKGEEEKKKILKKYSAILQDIFNNRLREYLNHFLNNLGVKRKISRYQFAVNKILDLYLNRDIYNLRKSFRKWSKVTLLSQIDVLKAQLIARILNGLFVKHDRISKDDNVGAYFNRWKKRVVTDNRTANKFQNLCGKFLNSSAYRNKNFSDNIKFLREFAEHYNKLMKNKALTIGDFIASFLKIYRKIQIMKRQKALAESLRRLNFLKKMQLLIACKRWHFKTAHKHIDDQASIIQKFLRQCFTWSNTKASVSNKATAQLDNFLKRVILYKMSQSSRLNKIITIVMKAFKTIPKELRKSNIRKAVQDWRDRALALKKQLGISMIQKHLAAWLVRRFLFKIKQKKFLLEDVLRKSFKKFFDAKLYYMSEWQRRNKLMGIKLNQNALGIWISDKFKNFQVLKFFRLMNQFIDKARRNDLIGTLNKLAKVQYLIKKLNGLVFKKFGKPLVKDVKNKYFKKKYSNVFGELVYQLRFCSVNYYAKKWRDTAMDFYNAQLIKIQTWLRMSLARLRLRRQLKVRKTILCTVLKVFFDEKIAKQGYINLWRAIVKYLNVDDEVGVLAKIIKWKNANTDFDQLMAGQRLGKLFNRYIISSIKDAIVEARNYKDSVIEILKNLDSKIEKRYAINNLVDFGKDSLRRSFLQLITGSSDKIFDNSRIRWAIEKWRCYSEKLLQIVLRLQRMRRNKVFREHIKHLTKVRDLLMRVTFPYLDDKQTKRVRCMQWRERARYFTSNDKATIIQNFLREHIDGLLLKNLQDFLDKAYRNHFINCIAEIKRFKKLKDALVKPLRALSLDKIRKRFILSKIRDGLLDIVGRTHSSNINNYKNDVIKKWRMNALKLKQQEMCAALLIVACIKGRLMRLKMRKFKDLNTKTQILLIKAFGGDEGLRRCCIIQWANNAKKLALIQNTATLVAHAKNILNKIKKDKEESRDNRMKRGGDIIRPLIRKNMIRLILDRFTQRNKRKTASIVDDLFKNRKGNNLAEFFRRLKLYAIYRENLIRRIQRAWRYRNKLVNFVEKICIMKTLVKLALNEKLYIKHAYTLTWRNNVRRMNDNRHASILQDFFRKLTDWNQGEIVGNLNKKKNLFKKYAQMLKSRGWILPLKKFAVSQRLNKLENIWKRKHFNYLKEKTLMLYILSILNGFHNKCDKKIKYNVVYKYRKIALRLRDMEAAGRIFNCLREVRNRRKDNKSREILVKIAFNRSLDEKEVLMKIVSDWCRNAYTAKIKENVGVIEKFLAKQKRRLDLKKRWIRLGARLAGKNGICNAHFILETTKVLKLVEPFIRVIQKRNIRLNGAHFLNNLKIKGITKYIGKSFRKIFGILDDDTREYYINQWRLRAYELKTKEQKVLDLGEMLRLKLLENAFRTVVGYYDFNRYAGYARIIQLHDAMKRIKSKAKAMEKVSKFSEVLVGLQQFHVDGGSRTFKDRLYKFYVYKILSNFCSIIRKVQVREHQLPSYELFYNKFLRNAKKASKTIKDRILKVADYQESILHKRLMSWKFKAIMAKIRDDKLKILQTSMINFENSFKYDFFDGPENVPRMVLGNVQEVGKYESVADILGNKLNRRKVQIKSIKVSSSEQEWEENEGN